MRLLPNLDPIGAARDREVLVPDAALRKRIWVVLGGPGLVLVDGAVGGLCAKKSSRRLTVTVVAVGGLSSAAAKDALAAEVERLAPWREAEQVDVAFA